MYYKRLVDDKIKEILPKTGCVLITGPKFCGKTETASQIAKTTVLFEDPLLAPEYIAKSKINPFLLLEGEKPLLIDEWQDIPVVWDTIRTYVDRNKSIGEFIITGSTSRANTQTKHTGAGRFAEIDMSVMSLYESMDSSGVVSLGDLFSQKEINGKNTTTLKDYARFIVRGGWPLRVITNNTKQSDLKLYLQKVIENDIANYSSRKRNINIANAALHSLARNISSLVSLPTMLSDIEKIYKRISLNTLMDYLDILKKLKIYYEIPAYQRSFMSLSSATTSKKKELIDPSLATILLGITENNIFNDMRMFGFLFESLAIRDLKIYIEHLGGSISYFRDASGNEVDAIVQLDGKIGAIEIKLGSGFLEEAINNLNKIEKSFGRKFDFKAVINGGNTIAKSLTDNIYIVPLTALKP